jgi:branched-chain amino acid transport system permease protein
MNLFLMNLLNGISLGMLLFLISIGLTIIFGVLGVLNFAHGSLYMLGAYFCFQSVALFHNFWLALLMAPVIVALIGGAIEMALLRPVYGRDISVQLLLTFGVLLVLDDAVRLIWGSGYHIVDAPPLLNGVVHLYGFTYPVYSLFILVMGPLIGTGLWGFFRFTLWGKKIRAASMDREMAAGIGIHVNRLFTGVFMFGTWLAGVGGALASPLRAIGPSMGEKIIIESFIVVVIGGLGSFPGAFAGALILGVINAYGAQFLPRMTMALPYILLSIILITKPRGLFAVKS